MLFWLLLTAMPHPYRYRLFGLTVEAEIPLGALPRARRGHPRFRLIKAARAVFPALPQWYHTIRDGKRRQLMGFARHRGEFLVDCLGLRFLLSARGYRIRFNGEQIASPELPSIFLGQILPLALTLAGREVLHASGVQTGQGALAFLGESGMGKSTLADAFLHQGFRLVSDDALCLRAARDQTWLVPSYPQLRLFGRGARKQSRTVGARFCRRRAPLRAIFVLHRGKSRRACARFEPLSLQESWRAVLAQSFRLDLRNPSRLERELVTLSAVLRTTPVFRLHYPTARRKLPRLVSALARDFGFERRAAES